ncbi:E3 ubiquitin-protein ligase RING1 [Platanthera zijinensis]|uniref:RING-type E3 ubiquitin transferase n=1 Tax=Platanthera zijinensis TaxID=2320716 RepID=A0AAP0FYB8_9ASPA
MAEVLELFTQLHEEEEEEEDGETVEDGEEEEEEDPYWLSSFTPSLVVPVFSSTSRSFSSCDSGESAIPVSDFSDYQFPLHHDFSDHTHSSPLVDSYPEALDSPNFEVHGDIRDYLHFDEAEEGTCGDENFVGRSAASAESSGGGLRIAEFGSESDLSEHHDIFAADCNDDGGAAAGLLDDLDVPLCWGFVPIEDARMNSSEEFDWEEVDDGVDDRGVLSMMVGVEDEETSSGRGEVVDVLLEADEAGGDVEEDEFGSGSNIIWEVLLAMNNQGMARNNSRSIIEHAEDISDFVYDQEVFLNPSDYEFQIAQFADLDSTIRGSPPAAKHVVEELASIMLTEEDVANNKNLCAVCKDVFLVEEKAMLLPCSHLYHSDCILPWLGIRNTCPVCRHELPTDDPEYERLKARMSAGHAAVRGNFSQV